MHLAIAAMSLSFVSSAAFAQLSRCEPEVRELPELSKHFFYMKLKDGSSLDDFKNNIKSITQGKLTLNTQNISNCPQNHTTFEVVRKSLRCASLLETRPIYHRFNPILDEEIYRSSCSWTQDERDQNSGTTNSKQTSIWRVPTIIVLSELERLAADAKRNLTEEEAEELVPYQARRQKLVERIAEKLVSRANEADGLDELSLVFDSFVDRPSHFCRDRFDKNYDRYLTSVLIDAVEKATEFAVKRNLVFRFQLSSDWQQDDISNGKLRYDHERSVLPTSGLVEVDDSLRRIIVSAGHGKQLNHAYELLSPETVFATRVVSGAYSRAEPLCLPVYFDSLKYRPVAACTARLKDIAPTLSSDAHSVFVEAYASADSAKNLRNLNIGLAHLRSRETVRQLQKAGSVITSTLGDAVVAAPNERAESSPGLIEDARLARYHLDLGTICSAAQTNDEDIAECAYQRLVADKDRARDIEDRKSAPYSDNMIQSDGFRLYWEDRVIDGWRRENAELMARIIAFDRQNLSSGANITLNSAGSLNHSNIKSAKNSVVGSQTLLKDLLGSFEKEMSEVIDDLKSEVPIFYLPSDPTASEGRASSGSRNKIDVPPKTLVKALETAKGMATLSDGRLVLVNLFVKHAKMSVPPDAPPGILEKKWIELGSAATTDDMAALDAIKELNGPLAQIRDLMARLSVVRKASTDLGELTDRLQSLADGSKDNEDLHPHPTAHRDCDTNYWPLRDTVGFVSAFDGPGEELRAGRFPGSNADEIYPTPAAVLFPKTVQTNEGFEIDETELERLIAYYASTSGQEEMIGLRDGGFRLLFIPHNRANLINDFWLYLHIVSTDPAMSASAKSAANNLLKSVEHVGFVHVKEDPQKPEAVRFYLYGPSIVVKYSEQATINNLKPLLTDRYLTSRLIKGADAANNKEESQEIGGIDWLEYWTFIYQRLISLGSGSSDEIRDETDSFEQSLPGVADYLDYKAIELDRESACIAVNGPLDGPRAIIEDLIRTCKIDQAWPSSQLGVPPG